MLLQRLDLSVAQPGRHILDREAGVLQQAVREQHARGREKVARCGQADAREPALAGAPVHARAGGQPPDRLHFLGGAQRFLEHPPKLGGQGAQPIGELVEQPAGRGAGGLALQHLAQALGVIVVAHEDHVADAALAECEQDCGELRRERGIEDQRQGGEQQT